MCPSIASDVSLMTLAISSAAAIVKLGSAKLSCAPFFSTLMDEIGRLMDMLGDFLPIDQVYNFGSPESVSWLLWSTSCEMPKFW